MWRSTRIFRKPWSMNNRVLAFLGIARKSGNLVLGYNKCEEAVKMRQLRLLFISTGASQNTKDKFYGFSERYHVPILEDFTPEELGSALGLKGIAVLGVKDPNMAKKIRSFYDGKEDEEINGGGPIVKDQSI